MAKPTTKVVEAVCYRCHPAGRPRLVQSQPRPGMLARVKGLVWEVTQTGISLRAADTTQWATLVPVGGGEERSAYSAWGREPAPYLLDGEAVTFEG